MLTQPNQKYRAAAKIRLQDRSWPDAVLTRAPMERASRLGARRFTSAIAA